MVKALKCPVCSGDIYEDKHEVYGIRYTCIVSNGGHYIGYMALNQSFFEEESLDVIVNNRKYSITQYNYPPEYSVLIVVRSESDEYDYSFELLSLKKPPFDFLHNDLDQSIKRLKTILTWR